MPKPATGELTWTADGPVARITLKGRKRESYLLAACRNEGARTSGVSSWRCSPRASVRQTSYTREARELLKTIASCAPALLPAATQVAAELAGGIAIPGAKSETATFTELAKDWTDGKLTERYPDHVKRKETAGRSSTARGVEAARQSPCASGSTWISSAAS